MNTKKAEPRKENSLKQNHTTRKTPRPSTAVALKIDGDLAHEILKRLPNHNTQYCAFAKILIRRGELLTGKANPLAGVNLSSVARESINPRIKDLRLVVDCRTPKEEIKTIYGTHSGQMYWGFYPV